MTGEQKPIYKLSRHAEVRCSQRGYRDDDISLVLQYGTSTADGFLMRKKDVREAVQDLGFGQRKVSKIRRELQLVQGLAGTLIVTAGDIIVTIQRADVAKQHRQLRRHAGLCNFKSGRWGKGSLSTLSEALSKSAQRKCAFSDDVLSLDRRPKVPPSLAYKIPGMVPHSCP